MTPPEQNPILVLLRIEHKLDQILAMLGDADSKVQLALDTLKQKTDALAAAVKNVTNPASPK